MDLVLPSAGALFASLLFSTIGFAAFVYGKKLTHFTTMGFGVALMAYPYFVDQLWLIYLIGVALCFGIYFFRE